MTASPLTLELLLTAPEGFGLTTASPLQRAVCRIADGLPLGDLAVREDVIAALGGIQAMDNLPMKRPDEVMILSGIRTFKSMLAAAIAMRAAWTCDLSGLGPGEMARVSVVSLRKDLADVVLDFIVGNMQAREKLRRLTAGKPTADSAYIRNQSGRTVEIKVVAGAPAGATLVARWSAGCIFDEAPRMNAADAAAVNYDDCRAAVLGRLLPGAQLVSIGSPWAPFGPVYERVQERWGKPSRELVIIRAPAFALNPVYWTKERCEALQRKDPQVYRTDVLAEFADPESSLFSSLELERATRKGPLELPPQDGMRYFAAIDPATRGNSWPLVVAHIEKIDRLRYRFVIDLVRQWTGRKSAPLSPDAVFGEIATILGRYCVTRLYTDQGAGADALADLARRRGLTLTDVTMTGEIRRDMYETLRTHVSTNVVEFPPATCGLQTDLQSVRKRITQTGFDIVLPKTSDGRHADIAAATALVIRCAAQSIDAYIPPIQVRSGAYAALGIPTSLPTGNPLDSMRVDNSSGTVVMGGGAPAGGSIAGNWGGF